MQIELHLFFETRVQVAPAQRDAREQLRGEREEDGAVRAAGGGRAERRVRPEALQVVLERCAQRVDERDAQQVRVLAAAGHPLHIRE